MFKGDSNMSKHCKRIWRCLVSMGFAACGVSKLIGIEAQQKRFANIQWSKKDMQVVGGIQLLGASMLTCKKSSKLGALILVATSLCMVTTSIKHEEKKEVPLDIFGFLAALSLLFCKKSKKQ